jgi:hypothetical protein
VIGSACSQASPDRRISRSRYFSANRPCLMVIRSDSGRHGEAIARVVRVVAEGLENFRACSPAMKPLPTPAAETP